MTPPATRANAPATLKARARHWLNVLENSGGPSGSSLIAGLIIRDLLAELEALSAREAELRKALQDLADEAETRLCHHEDIYRGGAIWTICNDCGRKWAHDQGGFVPYSTPAYIARALDAALNPKSKDEA